jgi:hypothetical protein
MIDAKEKHAVYLQAKFDAGQATLLELQDRNKTLTAEIFEISDARKALEAKLEFKEKELTRSTYDSDQRFDELKTAFDELAEKS